MNSREETFLGIIIVEIKSTNNHYIHLSTWALFYAQMFDYLSNNGKIMHIMIIGHY